MYEKQVTWKCPLCGRREKGKYDFGENYHYMQGDKCIGKPIKETWVDTITILHRLNEMKQAGTFFIAKKGEEHSMLDSLIKDIQELRED